MTDTVVRLVNGAIETGQPNAILNQLASETRKLLRDKISENVISEALREWDARPGIPPSFLAHIVSDILRAQRSRAAEQARQEKMLDWESRLEREMGD